MILYNKLKDHPDYIFRKITKRNTHPERKKIFMEGLIFINTKIEDDSGTLYIYGRLDDCRSICAKTETFNHYFYVLMGNDELSVDTLDYQLHEATRKSEESGEYIKHVEVVQKTSIMGYQHNGPVKMFKIYTNYVSFARKILEQKGYLTYEASINLIMRFMVDRKFGGFHWLKISKYNVSYEKESECDLEITFNDQDLDVLLDKSDMGPVRWMSFDIEACKGGNGRGFVAALSDPVSQIGITLFTSTHEVLDKRVFSLVPKGKSVSNCGITVEKFEDERNLFIAFRDYIIKRDPDVIVGYNIRVFDFPYLFDRAKVLKIDDEFLLLGKLKKKKATIRKSTFSSAAKGSRLDFSIKIRGRFDFDVLKFIKDTQKLRSYSLGNVANILLGYAKVEMPYENIPIYQAGTDDQRAHLCYYCWWDAHLCYELMKKQMAIVNYAETARVCGAPFEYLLDRGQQILTMSLLLRFGNPRGFVVPSSTESQNDEKTKGACVLEPKKGFYEDPIIVLDFRSLYPSIIDDSNVCYSTIVPIWWAKEKLKEGDYFIPPITGIDYCYVAEHIQVGILSQMEQILFAKRMDAKGDLKREKDPAKKEVLDGRQNAIKVRMNSIYGFLKANMVCDMRLMETVCGIGRYMIETSKALVEREFPGSEVIYGDSVTGDTPCIFKDLDGKIVIKSIEDISKDFIVAPDGKEYASTDLLTWTESGWCKIRKVIRHLTDKQIFRVVTGAGVVECTSDHGLIRSNGERISTKDLKIGESLLHSFTEEFYELEEFVESFQVKDKLKACKIYAYLKSLGHFVHIKYSNDIYNISISYDPETYDVKSIEPIEYKGYVYDLETENHHFHAGVGQMIVHNTDSIFIKFGTGISLDQAFEWGQKAADMCTELFTRGKKRKVHLLQREKAIHPCLLVGKKKYSGMLSLGPGLPFKRKETGLETVRRDNAKIGSETLDQALELVVAKGDYKGKRTIKFIHNEIRRLLLGQIEFSKLIISKNLSKSFEHYEKSGTTQPHVELAKKILARTNETGEAIYYTGDRVPYVMITGLKGSKSSECSEDPFYALKNRLPIDFKYYIENQMMKPLMRIMIPILAPHESMTKRNKKGDKVYLNDKEMQTLTTYKILFTGPHMLSKVQKVVEGGAGIMKFVKTTAGCVNCGARLRVKRDRSGEIVESAFCDECEEKKAITYIKIQGELNELYDKKWKCWTRCQACVGDKHAQQINCSNKDCDNLYEREKVVLDIEDLVVKINRI